MLLWNLLLAITWTAVTGRFTAGNFVLGLVLGWLALVLTREAGAARVYLRRIAGVANGLRYFAVELVRSALRVAWDVITPRHRMRPGVVAVPLEARGDLEIALLANAITLTPGTLSVDVSPERDLLYIHAMYVDDVNEVRRSVKDGFERRVLEMLR